MKMPKRRFLQASLKLYQANIQRARERYAPTPPKIATSAQFDQASKRIEEILSHENFEKRGNFNIKALQARAKELWRAEPAEIQAELDAYGKQLLANLEQAQQQAQKEGLSLDQVRALLAGETAIAYHAGIQWDGMPSAEYDTIVVAPTSDPWDALRIEGTQGNNFSISTEELITALKELDAVYGVDVTGAVQDGVEFTFKRVPKGKEAREVGKRLYEICPDLGKPPVKFPRGRVDLWWD
jgi:multidrug efflux pump subunit AcrA (membrane-fusion protein)